MVEKMTETSKQELIITRVGGWEVYCSENHRNIHKKFSGTRILKDLNQDSASLEDNLDMFTERYGPIVGQYKPRMRSSSHYKKDTNISESEE